MKSRKLFDAMRDIDDELLLDAAPKKRRISNQKRSRMSVWGILAASLVLVATLSVWLLIPYDVTPPDVSQYEGSQYYGVIMKLNRVTFHRPKYKNRLQMVLSKVEDFFLFAKAEDAGPGESATGDAYRETTDNQVAGVIEGDILKRSDRYMYYFDTEGWLSVYSIEGEASKKVGSHLLVRKPNTYPEEYAAQMYLSADGRTVTLIAPFWQKINESGYSYGDNARSCVDVISLDVSDPTNIREKNRVTVSGSYLSSRMVDGKLLLLTSFYVGKNPDFSREECFLPQIDAGEGFHSLLPEDIVSPETLSSPRYTVVCRLDEATLAVEDSAAFLSYSNGEYVSSENLYVTRSYTETYREGLQSLSVKMTEVSVLGYREETMAFRGSVTLKGYVKDQYSLDEWEGILRVVTTVEEQTVRENLLGNAEMTVSNERDVNASLWCIDLSTMQVVAAKERFAPDGEMVQSVRFDGDMAYVCTSIQLSDPVFFFDLSDLSDITVTDTGTIDGFSSSLIQLGDGFLLGIGRGSSWSTAKLEIYEESDAGVVSVCKYEVAGAYVSSVYKSYFIDREHWLVGLGIRYEGTGYQPTSQQDYVLLAFDGNRFVELVKTPLGGSLERMRAVIVDEYLYLFGSEEWKVVPLS